MPHIFGRKRIIVDIQTKFRFLIVFATRVRVIDLIVSPYGINTKTNQSNSFILEMKSKLSLSIKHVNSLQDKGGNNVNESQKQVGFCNVPHWSQINQGIIGGAKRRKDFDKRITLIFYLILRFKWIRWCNFKKHPCRKIGK